MSNPTELKYLESHEWMRVDGDVVTLGITAFAAEELTDITYVDLPAVGTKVEAGKEVGEIESVKATSELMTGVSGEIVEVNEKLADAPELVNSDPFGEGWMVKVKASDLSGLETAMDAATYEKHISSQG